MSEPLSVDTDGLRRDADRYGYAADRVRNAALRFADQVSSQRGCFGGDKEGQRMNDAFGELFRGLYGGMLNFAAAVDGTGDGVRAMAEQFAAAEDRNTRLADSLAPAPEPTGLPDLPSAPGVPGSGFGGGSHHGRH